VVSGSTVDAAAACAPPSGVGAVRSTVAVGDAAGGSLGGVAGVAWVAGRVAVAVAGTGFALSIVEATGVRGTHAETSMTKTKIEQKNLVVLM